MKIEEVLQSLGLNEKEIMVYLALLPIGSVPASMLGKRTGITRSTAQYTCQQLEKKGLIKVIQKNNTFIYSPEPPEKLLFLLDNQKKQIEEKEDSVKRIIGDLKGMINPLAVLPKVRFFDGIDGIIDMLNDVLNENSTLYGALRINKNIHPEINKYLLDVYTPKRKELGNKAFILFNDDPLTQEYRKNDAKVNRISMILPLKDFPFDACCHVYGNKVAFYSWEQNDLTGVLIQNEKITNTQFSIFKLAWIYARGMKINKQYSKINLS